MAARHAGLRAGRVCRRDARRTGRTRLPSGRASRLGRGRADRDRPRPSPPRRQRPAPPGRGGGRPLIAENPRMHFAPLVDRIAGRGSAAWAIHIEARRRQEAGEDIIFLTVGDPDQAPPEAVIDATVAALRQHRTAYAPTIGYPVLREAIAARVA